MSEINKTNDPLMRMTQANDIYIDYLITQNAQSTATGCAKLLDNQVKHDSFTRMLQKGRYTFNLSGRLTKPQSVKQKTMTVR